MFTCFTCCQEISFLTVCPWWGTTDPDTEVHSAGNSELTKVLISKTGVD